MKSQNWCSLSSGTKVPTIGLGTWQIEDPETIYSAIADLGYRHINTGSFNGNEELIGEEWFNFDRRGAC